MKENKTLAIRISDFKKIADKNNYFVDKTEFIYNFFNSKTYISLLPQLKQFGKTLKLSMIEHFFYINKKESARLFDEFKIYYKKEFCKQHQNKYPVINLSLKNIKATNWNENFNHFRNKIVKTFILFKIRPYY